MLSFFERKPSSSLFIHVALISMSLLASLNNLSILKPTLLFFFFIFFLLHGITIAIPKSAYNPPDIILVNCGSSNDTSTNGRKWYGDLESTFGSKQKSFNKSVAANALSQESSVEFVPYMSARISRSPFMYTFFVSSGQIFIRLYFYPAWYQHGFNRSKDFFDVTVGRFTLLRNFSASLLVDDWGDKTVIKEFCINVEENQQLNVTFAPFLSDSNDSYAFINGIEIVSMPTNLYYTPPNGIGLPFIGQNREYYIQNDTALSKVCRLNVGGSSISPTQDTGMYRLWDDDSYYFYEYGVIPYADLNVTLNYSKIPPYTAPNEVYFTARSMGSNRTNNLLNNLTWEVPVDGGFKHLVRLHFCEFVTLVTEVQDRRFTIFIDNQTAEVDFNVFELSGGLNIPIYRDYVVMAGKEGEAGDYSIFLSLHPNGSAFYADAILNGLEVFKLSNSDGSLAGNNRPPPVPAPALAPVQRSTIKKSNTKKTLLIAIGGSVLGLLIILSLLCCIVIWRLRKKKHCGSFYEPLTCCWRSTSYKGKSSRKKDSSLPDELCRHFSLVDIKAATNDFHEELIIGVGGFGNVYRGEIDEGAMVVAIKRLNPESRQGAREFKTEIEMLSQLRHVHLVSLIGYCNDGGEMILVYDYMINGTLREHLYETNNDPLPWKQRLEICIGAARGLHYLHAGVTNTIIHRDVKTTNILLDENWVAKVSDFGLSKIGINNTAVSTIVKGTWGYLDPEYARRQQLTEKSDVYSFGVVLFEVLCARKPLNQKLVEEQWNLANWARKCIQNGTIHEIIDPYLMGRITPECFNKFVGIAQSCVRDQGIERPTMHDVMEKLEFTLELQEAADAEKEGKNPGGEYVYPETSFHAPRYTNVVGESELDSSGASGLSTLDTNTSGLTYPTLESGSLKSSHAFFDTTNSTA